MSSPKKTNSKIDREVEQIERHMMEYAEKIAQLERAMKANREDPNTLPPLERYTINKHREKIYTAIGEGTAQNKKRDMKNNALLLLLLIAAIVSASIFASVIVARQFN